MKSDAECNETVHAIAFDRFQKDSHISNKKIPNMSHKIMPAGSDTFTRWLSSNKNLVHISIIVYVKAVVCMRLTYHHKIKKYEV